MFSQRFPRSAERPGSAPPWLRVIHAANGIDHIFGEPNFTGQREGVGYVEEYLDAEVIFPADDPITVKILAKTERGDRVLTQVTDDGSYGAVVVDGTVVARTAHKNL